LFSVSMMLKLMKMSDFLSGVDLGLVTIVFFEVFTLFIPGLYRFNFWGHLRGRFHYAISLLRFSIAFLSFFVSGSFELDSILFVFNCSKSKATIE